MAMAIDRRALSRQKWMEYGTFWWFAVAVFFFGGSLWLLLEYDGCPGSRAWPFLGAATVLRCVAWWDSFGEVAEPWVLRAQVTSVVVAIAVYWPVVPALAMLFPRLDIPQALRAADCDQPKVASAGYH